MLEEFRKKKVDFLTEREMEVWDAMTPEKLKRASFSQLIIGFGIIDERRRLEQGLSTQNVGVVGAVLDMRKLVAELEAKSAMDVQAEGAPAPDDSGSRQEHEKEGA